MKCDKIRELLLTDYLDGEADAGVCRLIDAHLTECAFCREYAEMAKSAVHEAFETSERLEVPPQVWENVRARISSIAPRQCIADRFRRLIESLTMDTIRPVIAAAMMVAMVLSVNLVLRRGTPGHPAAADSVMNGQVAEGLLLLAQSGEDTDVSAFDFGTGFEDFFL